MPNWIPEPGSPIDRAATFVMANLVWLVFAVFIVPLPAATAALFATFAPWIRGKDTEFFAIFFGTLRRQWRKSTVIGVLDAALGFIIFMNWRALGLMGLGGSPLSVLLYSATILLTLVVLMTNVYLWPLLVLFDLPVRRLISLSLRLALAHPFWTIAVVLIGVLVVIVALILPPIVGVLAVSSAEALVINWGAWRIIRRYATPEELVELDQH